jgi:hypothetical protein
MEESTLRVKAVSDYDSEATKGVLDKLNIPVPRDNNLG